MIRHFGFLSRYHHYLGNIHNKNDEIFKDVLFYNDPIEIINSPYNENNCMFAKVFAGKEYYIIEKIYNRDDFFELISGVIYVNNGSKFYYKRGVLHNDSDPSVITVDGTKKYYKMGKLHREKFPAILWSNGDEEYWVDGNRHRLDGPAIVCKNGNKEYWVNGKRHNDRNPAVIYDDGDYIAWWKCGLLHRDDGYALGDKKNKILQYWKNGMLHNENGPAHLNNDGKYYFINDILFSSKNITSHITRTSCILLHLINTIESETYLENYGLKIGRFSIGDDEYVLNYEVTNLPNDNPYKVNASRNIIDVVVIKNMADDFIKNMMNLDNDDKKYLCIDYKQLQQYLDEKLYINVNKLVPKEISDVDIQCLKSKRYYHYKQNVLKKNIDIYWESISYELMRVYSEHKDLFDLLLPENGNGYKLSQGKQNNDHSIEALFKTHGEKMTKEGKRQGFIFIEPNQNIHIAFKTFLIKLKNDFLRCQYKKILTYDWQNINDEFMIPIDTFIVKGKYNKKNNTSCWYLSDNNVLGIIFDEHNGQRFVLTKCIRIEFSHNKKVYHIYPVIDEDLPYIDRKYKIKTYTFDGETKEEIKKILREYKVKTNSCGIETSNFNNVSAICQKIIMTNNYKNADIFKGKINGIDYK
jgi:hypothetical protein